MGVLAKMEHDLFFFFENLFVNSKKQQLILFSHCYLLYKTVNILNYYKITPIYVKIGEGCYIIIILSIYIFGNSLVPSHYGTVRKGCHL
jgi:hypothetical protein